MDTMIDDYVAAVGRGLKRTPKNERLAIQREIHAHLSEDVRERMAAGADQPTAVKQALAAFGDAKDIGLAYNDPGALVNQTTGQTVLRIAAATGRVAGRGAKGALKWGGIVTASLVGLTVVLLAMGLLFAGTVLTVFQDDIREATPRPVYLYDEHWETSEANTDLRTDSFQINGDVKEFKILIDVTQETGCAAITLTSPSGEARDINGNGCNDTHFASTFVEAGTWQIRYAYGAFSGDVEVSVFSFENA